MCDRAHLLPRAQSDKDPGAYDPDAYDAWLDEQYAAYWTSLPPDTRKHFHLWVWHHWRHFAPKDAVMLKLLAAPELGDAELLDAVALGNGLADNVHLFSGEEEIRAYRNIFEWWQADAEMVS